MGGTTEVVRDAMRGPAPTIQPISASAGFNNFSWIRPAEVLLDVITVFYCVTLAFHIAVLKFIGLPTRMLDHEQVIALVFTCIMVVLLDRAGTYRESGGLLRIRETAGVLESVFLLAAAIIVPCTLLTGSSRWALLALLEVPILALALILQKHALHILLAGMRRRGISRHRVLVYGDGVSAKVLYAALARSPKLGFNPIALVKDVCSHRSPLRNESNDEHGVPIPVLHGELNASLIREHRADIVVISSPFASSDTLQRVIAECVNANASVFYGTELAFVDYSKIDYIELDGQIVYGEQQIRPRRAHEILSRAMDILVSSVMILVAALPAVLITLAIRMESEGSILFHQVRIGHNGIPFTILKFRTMHERFCGDSVSPASSADRRITRVGKWLRRSSFDELPQLLNVLRGDMALVGPRPEMPFIVRSYSDSQRLRLSVKPGLTGIWQISAARRYPIHENLHYDMYYLKHRSLAMDIALLFHTLFFAISGI